MPTMTTAVTATTTHQLVIAPQLKRKLLLALKTYTELAAQAKVLALAKKKQSGIVEGIQTELGESSIDIDGYKSTIVAPIRKVFDKKKFITLGGNLDIYEAAMVDTPRRAYAKITAPGATNGDDD
mgnify:CR=1 FL=1